MQDLIVTIIQSELVWEDTRANLAMFEQKIDAIEEDTHLIVLPEMFTTGFSMNPQSLAQKMDDTTVAWIRKTSADNHADVTASVIIEENGRYFNRLLWAKPDGQLLTYDKRHLFRMLGEEKVYSAGKKPLTVKLNGWKLRPFICYDLRFPVFIRNLDNQYDVAVFIANWPEKRSSHWKTLLQARAIENQCYVIGVNRVGTDGNDLTYSGDSSIIDPMGTILFSEAYNQVTKTIRLTRAFLETTRSAFPVWKDADKDLVKEF